MTTTYEQALGSIAETDDRVVVMTAENRAHIRNLPARLGNRFIDVGIAEQTLIGMASGLALRGRIPVVHGLAAFLTMRSFEFIRTDIGIGGLPAKLVGFVPGTLSDANGPTHQALEDVALMRGIPGMNAFCPADLDDLLIGLPAILADDDPWYIRYTDRPAIVSHNPEFVPGRAETLMTGDDICFIVAGVLLREAIEAARLLNDAGLSVRLLNVRTIKPFDHHAVLDAMRGARLTVTIEDHFLTGGLHSVVAEALLRVGETANVLPIAFAERWFTPALFPDVLRHEGLLGPQLADRTLAAFHRLNRPSRS